MPEQSHERLTKQGVEVVDESWENVLAGLVAALRSLPESSVKAAP